MSDKPIDEMTPEELDAAIREKSPALAFVRDHLRGKTTQGFESWRPGVAGELGGVVYNVPGEIAAAIETNRVELLRPVRNRIEGGEPLTGEGAMGVFSSLTQFYAENVQEPVLSELLEALAPVGKCLATSEPDVEVSLLLLDKLQMVMETIDHRRKEVQEGAVPIDQIPDGQARSVSF